MRLRKGLYVWILIGKLTASIRIRVYIIIGARWMFDCCRVPGPHGLDWSVSYAKQGDSGDLGHIVVFRNNRVWKVETAQNGRILSTAEIEKYETRQDRLPAS